MLILFVYIVKLKKVGLREKRDMKLFWDSVCVCVSEILSYFGTVCSNMASYSEQYRQRVLANKFCKSASVVHSSKIVA